MVGRAQLLDAGCSDEEINWRLQAGRLHRVHAGVYAVGHRLITREGRWMAAVLRAGSGSSHRPGDPAGGVPGGGAGPQVSRPSEVAMGIFGPPIAGVSRVTSAIAFTRERTSRTSLLSPW
ncbi:MAG: hypothetical protein ACTHN7_02300 [Solirubrobacterales bacterium]